MNRERGLRTDDNQEFIADGTRWLSKDRMLVSFNKNAEMTSDTDLNWHNVPTTVRDRGWAPPWKGRVMSMTIAAQNIPGTLQAIDLIIGDSVVKTLNFNNSNREITNSDGWDFDKHTGRIRCEYKDNALDTSANRPQVTLVVRERW